MQRNPFETPHVMHVCKYRTMDTNMHADKHVYIRTYAPHTHHPVGPGSQQALYVGPHSEMRKIQRVRVRVHERAHTHMRGFHLGAWRICT
jgi:hypothetical protein